LVVLTVQSVSALHPHTPSASHAVPSAFVVQSDAAAHATQVLVVGLQTLASGFAVQSVDAVHSTHVLVVVSQTRATPVMHCVFDVHETTHVFVVVLHTSVVGQFEVATHWTHLPAAEQYGKSWFVQSVCVAHSTHVPDEQTAVGARHSVLIRHSTQVLLEGSQYGVAMGQAMASTAQATVGGASASDPEEPGEPDDPDEVVAPDELDVEPDELVTVPDDDNPPEPPLLDAAPSPPAPPGPPSPVEVVDAVEPPHAAKRPSDTQSDTPRRLRKTTMVELSSSTPFTLASRTGRLSSPGCVGNRGPEVTMNQPASRNWGGARTPSNADVECEPSQPAPTAGASSAPWPLRAPRAA
jgi:hypothetical protein